MFWSCVFTDLLGSCSGPGHLCLELMSCFQVNTVPATKMFDLYKMLCEKTVEAMEDIAITFGEHKGNYSWLLGLIKQYCDNC